MIITKYIKYNKYVILSIIFIYILYKYIDYYDINNMENLENINNMENLENIKPTKIYYCGKYKINSPFKNAIDSLNLQITKNIIETELYFPCGFNNVELELNKFRFVDKTNTEYNLKNKVFMGVLGCDKLCSKNEIWNKLQSYYNTEEASKIMPLSFIIKNQNDLLKLKDIENEMIQQNKKSIYILKNNNQGKKGLYMTDNILSLIENKTDIINNINDSIYKNDKIYEYKVIQKYITNPFLINKRKLNIRLYVLIINIKKLNTKWYLFKDGKCIYNNKDYNKLTSLLTDNLQDKEQHFTSLNLDYNYVYNDLGNPETLDELNNYIGNNDYNYLLIKILDKLKKIKYVYNTGNVLNNKDNLKKNITLQYFGIDVILDDKLEPYILEFNKGPEMKYNSPNDEKMKNDMVYTTLNIAIHFYHNNLQIVKNILNNKFIII